MEKEIFDVIILGGGPAGLTAGIYTSRARMKTLILNEGTIGGQLVLTHEIANYPGVEATSGYQLGTIMKKQALSFGCQIKSNVRVTGIDLSQDMKKIEVDGKDFYYGRSIILSPGGLPRTLNIPGETEFKGKGVSYCATCDGDFFTNKEIVVVGGGNSALEEAVSLTKYASKVTIVHQFDHFQAFPHAIIEAEQNPKIDFVMKSVLTGITGDESVRGVEIKNVDTGNLIKVPVDGVFIFIGYVANTKDLIGMIPLNAGGEIIVDNEMKTAVQGVFAAGDCIQKKYRQVTTSVGEGTIAALSAVDYVNKMKQLIKQDRLGMMV